MAVGDTTKASVFGGGSPFYPPVKLFARDLRTDSPVMFRSGRACFATRHVRMRGTGEFESKGRNKPLTFFPFHPF